MRKVFVRLFPLLMGLYTISYIDRVNVGFASNLRTYAAMSRKTVAGQERQFAIGGIGRSR